MRFIQFLAENERDDAASEKAILKMESECAPFLEELGSRKRVLWRGFNRRFSLPANHIVQVRADRKPVDTQLELHHAMDDWFLDNFGHRYRSNAVFASGSEKHSAVYGDLYAIYPIGDYEYVWSPKVKDTLLLDEHARQLLTRIENQSGLKFDKDEWLEQKAAIIIDIMDKSRYTDAHLYSALSSGHEIMVHCDAYYAFHTTDGVWRQWCKHEEKE
jgi:hypothetical protein